MHASNTKKGEYDGEVLLFFKFLVFYVYLFAQDSNFTIFCSATFIFELPGIWNSSRNRQH